MFKKTLQTLTIAALFATAALALPVTASAQDSTPASASSAQQKQAQKLLTEYRETATKVNGIRQATIKANPKLKKQRDDFKAMVKSRLQKNGYDIETKTQLFKKLRGQLQDENTSKADKQKATSQLREEGQKLRKVQAKVMQDPDVKKAAEKLGKDELAAMKKHDAKTGALIDKLKSLRKQLSQVIAAASNKGS